MFFFCAHVPPVLLLCSDTPHILHLFTQSSQFIRSRYNSYYVFFVHTRRDQLTLFIHIYLMWSARIIRSHLTWSAHYSFIQSARPYCEHSLSIYMTFTDIRRDHHLSIFHVLQISVIRSVNIFGDKDIV